MTPAEGFMAELQERHGDPDPYGEICIPASDGGICRIAVAPCGGNQLWLDRISVDAPQQRQGHGTRILRQILALADQHGCQVALEAFWRPGSARGGWLIAFYERLGFKPDGGLSEDGYQELTRAPQVPSHSNTPDTSSPRL